MFCYHPSGIFPLLISILNALCQKIASRLFGSKDQGEPRNLPYRKRSIHSPLGSRSRPSWLVG